MIARLVSIALILSVAYGTARLAIAHADDYAARASARLAEIDRNR